MKYSSQLYPENLLSEIDFSMDNLPDDFPGTLEYVLHTCLTERECTVIHGRFRDAKTLDEIGKAYGVGKETIRQNERHALRKLRDFTVQEMLSDGLREYYKTIEKKHCDTAFRAGEKQGYERGYADCRAEKQNIIPPENPVNESAEVETLDLSVRSFNCLKRAGKNTIRDVLDMTAADFLNCRNMGRKSIEEVFNKLELLGYDLTVLRRQIFAG